MMFYRAYLYRLCQKKLYNFHCLIAEKVDKAQQQQSRGQNMIFLCVRRFSNDIIPWTGVKVMVHCVMSGKNKVGHFHPPIITWGKRTFYTLRLRPPRGST